MKNELLYAIVYPHLDRQNGMKIKSKSVFRINNIQQFIKNKIPRCLESVAGVLKLLSFPEPTGVVSGRGRRDGDGPGGGPALSKTPGWYGGGLDFLARGKNVVLTGGGAPVVKILKN
jgi:hypothetical protein